MSEHGDWAAPGGAPGAGGAAGPPGQPPRVPSSSAPMHDASGGRGEPSPGGEHGGGTTTVLKAGRSMAITAWIAVAAGVAILAGVVWSLALDVIDGGLAQAEAGTTGELNAMQVAPGMCLEDATPDGAVRDVVAVDCADPHRALVVTTMTFNVARFPGHEEAALSGLDFCETRVDRATDAGATWVVWVPTQDSWDRGDRLAACVALWDEPRQGELTASDG